MKHRNLKKLKNEFLQDESETDEVVDINNTIPE